MLGGYVPGTIYGKDYENNVLKRLVIIRDKDLRRELRVWGTAFENTLFELSVVKLDGLDSKTCSTYEAKSEDKDQVIEKFVVVPRQTQLNPGYNAQWLDRCIRSLATIICANYHK